MPQSRTEGTILVIAKGQDEIYYRIEGKTEDLPEEASVSEELLRPLLELIASR